MSNRNLRHAARSLATIAALATAAAAVLAQGAASQVPGATLTQWLNQKVVYAGLNRPSGCMFVNRAEQDARALYITCPDGMSHKLNGTLEVKGDRRCSRFGGNGTDECVLWYRVGEGQYEQRLNDVVISCFRPPACRQDGALASQHLSHQPPDDHPGRAGVAHGLHLHAEPATLACGGDHGEVFDVGMGFHPVPGESWPQLMRRQPALHEGFDVRGAADVSEG